MREMFMKHAKQRLGEFELKFSQLKIDKIHTRPDDDELLIFLRGSKSKNAICGMSRIAV